MSNKTVKHKRKREGMINKLFVLSLIVITIVMMVGISRNNKKEGETNNVVYESAENVDHNTVVSPATILPNEIKLTEKQEQQNYIGYDKIAYDRNWSKEEAYMLAKIAMAEAEGESLETKVLVILTVLNRVHSNEKYFPDTIKEVIFQSRNGVYQFTPVQEGGRWWRVEPNDECWEAVDIVSQLYYDISCGALYFEACKGESWHSKNLEFICQSSNTRFYK